jgi:hypothetical protein
MESEAITAASDLLLKDNAVEPTWQESSAFCHFLRELADQIIFGSTY